MPILVTGGARSGKSRFAERLCMTLAPSGVYVATSQIYDEEMRERVRLHRLQRERAEYAWETIEEPYGVSGLLEQWSKRIDAGIPPAAAAESSEARVVLVDCLTLWLSNWLLRADSDGNWNAAADAVGDQIDALVAAAAAYAGPLVFVTNEVGDGIVPEYPLGRVYRDLAGSMNQKLAALCDQVFLVTAGIPIELKSRAYRL